MMLFAAEFYLPWRFFVIVLTPIWGGALTLYLVYVITLHQAISAVTLENRSMRPRLIWLLLVPGFNLVWLIVVVFFLANSLKSEFRKRDLRPFDSSFGKDFGVTLLSCTVVALIAETTIAFCASDSMMSAFCPLALLTATFAIGIVGHFWVILAALDQLRPPTS
jgi:hypothetical protein